jgi:hypothetical protein
MAQLATNVLNEVFSEYLTEEINREATLLRLVPKSTVRQDYVKWSVNVGGAVITGQSITSEAPNISQDKILPASIKANDGSLQSAFLLNDKEILEAREQVSAVQLRDLLRANMSNAVDEMMVSLNRYLYTGEGEIAAGGIYGIDLAVHDSDISVKGNRHYYAGISAAQYPIWSAAVTRDTESNGDPKSLSENMLYKMDRLIRQKGGRFDFIITSPAVLQEYKQLFATQRTFVINGNAIADLGFGVGEYAGIPIIDDPHVPVYSVNGKEASSMYFMRLGDLQFLSAPTDNSEAQGANAGSIFTQMDLMAKTALYTQKYVVGCIPQLVLRSRKNCGKIMNIAV